MLRLSSAALMALALAACSTTPPPAPAPAPAPAPVAMPEPAPVVAAPAPAPAPVPPAPEPVAAPAPAAVVVAPPPATPAPTLESKAKAVPLAPHLDPASDISRVRSVYFDFDRAVLRADATPVIEMHGKYLSGAGAVQAVVEGNTDERGSSEYNLALGQRRAEAVVKQLKITGAKDNQLEATSYGKERPAAAGHDEGAWSQNRRADIRYK